MNNNDQWFQPGDKVMKVQDTIAPDLIEVPDVPDAEYGRIYAISECWHNLGYNWVDLVGFASLYDEDGVKIAWLARDFRKVEEIRLCVKAAQMKPTKKGEEVKV